MSCWIADICMRLKRCRDVIWQWEESESVPAGCSTGDGDRVRGQRDQTDSLAPGNWPRSEEKWKQKTKHTNQTLYTLIQRLVKGFGETSNMETQCAGIPLGFQFNKMVRKGKTTNSTVNWFKPQTGFKDMRIGGSSPALCWVSGPTALHQTISGSFISQNCWNLDSDWTEGHSFIHSL